MLQIGFYVCAIFVENFNGQTHRKHGSCCTFSHFSERTLWTNHEEWYLKLWNTKGLSDTTIQPLSNGSSLKLDSSCHLFSDCGWYEWEHVPDFNGSRSRWQFSMIISCVKKADVYAGVVIRHLDVLYVCYSRWIVDCMKIKKFLI